ncbi:hypothetical protein KKA85_13030 [bacterium]|nr:hypothetical protein [bacterium]MBU1676689.1 hypothetical protein [bacterium]
MERTNYDPENDPGRGQGPYAPPPHQGQIPPLPPPIYGRRELPYKSQAFAIILSVFLPSMGHVYVGFYKQAFTIILVIASLVMMLASGTASGMEPLLGMLTGFVYFYQIFDAGRRASVYNSVLETGQAGMSAENIDLPETNPFVGGVILVLVGSLALLHTLLGLSMAWLKDWWPIFMIGIGVWLINKGRKERLERQDSRES